MTQPAESEQLRRARLRVGTTIRGKYRIDDVLGVGGMAVVYRATHRNQAEFAIKMLHPELSFSEDLRKRFLREGYAANSVKHPGVVQVVDDDVAEDGAAFLVMELLRGTGVESLVEQHDMHVPVIAAICIVDQLLDVLASAHEKGIIHRDIKPANLFLAADGTVKVLDFGIARVRDAMASGAQGTHTGMLLGTPAFMAPEQAKALTTEINAQTDLWAVGATFFTLVCGQFVHLGENPALLLINSATTPARSVSSVGPVPPLIAAVVDRALAFEKRNRWTSAGEMRSALREAARATYGLTPSRDSLLAALTPSGASSSFERLPQTLALSAPKPRLMGGTTAQPVSTREISGIPKRSYRGLVAIGLAVGAVLMAGGVWRFHAPSKPAVSAIQPETSPTKSIVAVPSEVPTQPIASSAPAASASAVVVSTPTSLSVAATPPTPNIVPTASQKPHRPALNCNPNYVLDEHGLKIFKKECF